VTRPAPRLLLAALLAAGVAAPRAVRADSAPLPRADASQVAREHYDRGTVRYTLGDFDGAITEFKLAYEASRAPALLYNLAQAHRLKKDPERAVYFYRTYLRELPDAPNRVDAEARIAELEHAGAPPSSSWSQSSQSSQSQSSSSSSSSRRQVARMSPAPASLFAAPPPPPGRQLRIAGFTTGGAGVALLAIGIGLGVDSQSKQDALSSRAHDHGTWDADAQAQFASGQSEAAAATALVALGGATLGVGAILVAVGYARDARARRAHLTAVRGGAAVEWRF
jgi:tetratricopeptide (TPR) repeat protein